MVIKKLLGRRPIPELTALGRLLAILSAFFPSGPAAEHFTPQAGAPFTSITENEIVTIAHTLPIGKAPGPDGIPDAVIRAVALARSREVAMVFNQCLEKGLFPGAWKSARLVLIRKPGKPQTLPSSYRPLSLINTMVKLFERVIKRRLEAHLDAVPEEISCHQYGFRKGRSTLDALEAVSGIVQRAGSCALAGRDLCVLVAIDIANAFNTAPWRKIEEALCRKSVPGYLMNIVRSYLSDLSQLLTDAGSMALTCGVPHGSVIGPLLWNIFYDDLLRLEQPNGVQLVGFADEIAIVGTAHTTDLQEEAMNPALAIVAEQVNSNRLSISVAKTHAIMLTNKRA